MTVKTAISLEPVLFEKMGMVIQELDISQNRFISTAIEHFIKHYETRRMMKAIDEAYDDFPDEDEKAILAHNVRYQREVRQDETW